MQKIVLITFSILLSLTSFAQPPNDACAGAFTVTPDGTCYGPGLPATTTTGASDLWVATLGCAGNNNEVWFTFVATNTQLDITVTGGTMGDNIEFILVEDLTPPCGTLILHGSACGPSVLTNSFTGLSIGATYYFTVSSSTSAGGDGTFQVCVNNVPTPILPGQDCPAANVLCNTSSFSLGSMASGAGAIFGNGSEEDMSVLSCFGGDERQSQWYTFTCSQTGTIEFNIDPVVNTDDYDWVLFNTTASGCALNSGGAPVIACNWSGCPDGTGLSSSPATEPGAVLCGGPPGPCGGGTYERAFCNESTGSMVPPTLIAGETYVLLIDNFSITNNGFVFTWGGVTNGMTSTIGPEAVFTNINVGCTFTFASVTVVPNYTYTWDFGDGSPLFVGPVPPAHLYAGGSYTATLTVTDALGCSDIFSTVVSCCPGYTAAAGPDQSVCAGSTATMAGGFGGGASSITWTNGAGDGTFNNNTLLGAIYTPGIGDIAAGTVTLTITTDDPDGAGPCLGATDFMVLTINPTPILTFTALADLCLNAGVQAGLGGATPTGGVYSGTGVTDDGNGTTYSFDPAAAGVGVHTITYSYTDGNSCSNTINDAVEVFALPTVTFTALADLCLNAGVQAGLGSGTPTGGVYSGPGVTDDGNGTTYSFDPAAAGVGVHTITYNFTDVNGCSGSANDNVEVFALPSVTFTALADLCLNAGVQAGLGSGTPTGGVYSGTGVTDDGNGNTYSFDPAAAGVGVHTITYNFTDGNGCSGSANDNVEVFALPTVTFTALADLCLTAGVQAGLGSGTPTGGVYSGPGVTDDGNGTTYSFDPAAAGVGVHTITYNFTDGNGCSGSANDNVEVFALPTVTFTALADLCLNAGVQAGLGSGTPTGGVYSGAGVTDDGNGNTYSFDPAAAGVGVHTITYNFTDGNGCSGSANDAVEVFALPVIAFTAPVDLCITSGVQAGLGSGTPTGGVYSGAGVTDDGNGMTYSFDPLAAGLGVHTVTYNFTNGNGCSGSANDDVEVFALPVLTFTAPADLCINAGVQAGLGGATPVGGVYSGPGVTDDGNGTTYSFDPAAAGVGAHIITYSYTDGGGCSNTINDNVEVFALPVLTFTAPADLCINGGVQAGLGGGTPTGGVYSGPGVTDDGNGTTYSFDPAAAGAGVHTITYNFTDVNSCSGSANDDVEVFALPVVAFTAPADLCINAGVQAGLGSGTPTGGVYSGPSVTDDGNGTTYSFDPATAGVGIHIITYTYTDVNGCTSSANDNIEVFALPLMSTSQTALTGCNTGDGIITVSDLGGATGTVSWTGTASGSSPGVTLPFDITPLAAGTYDVTFTDNATGCTSIVSQETLVNPGAPVIDPISDTVSCAVDYQLLYSLISGTGLTGGEAFYTASGGNLVDIIADGTIFTSPAGPLTVYAFDQNGLCSSEESFVITINALPVLTFTASADLCIDAGVQAGLGGATPSGGVYSGVGITDDGNGTTYSFDPAVAGAGIHTITYDYTDGNGCSESASDDVEVFALPVIVFIGPNDICANWVMQVGLGGATPMGGVYSGAGIVDDGNGTTYSFDPAAAGVGVHTITYTYTDGNSCTNSALDDVEVFDVPIASFTAPADLCIDAGVQVGLGGGTPVGGIYVGGPQVTDDGNGMTYSFDPSIAGSYTITYIYSDMNGCVGTSGDAVQVFQLPVVAYTAPADLCINAGVQVGLGGGTAIGGVYSGTGVTDDGNGTTYSFDPTVAGIGVHTITYDYSDVNGCSGSANDDVEVFALPVVTFTALADLCVDAGVQAGLGSGSATGGVYSGPGVTDDGNGTTYSFDPAAAGVGTHTITYTFSDVNGCTNSANDDVEVFALPVVTFTALVDLCVDAGIQAGLGSGSATGGVYSGPGVTDDGNGTTYSFDPAAAGVGIHTITYTFTDGNSCANTATDDVEVFAIPTLTFTAPADLCIDAGIQAGLGGATPTGGVYSGTGVTDDGNGTTYSFDPASAGVGVHIITYDYADGNGCLNSITDDVEVLDLPVINTAQTPLTGCNTNDGIIAVSDAGGATGIVTWTGPSSGNSGSVTLPYDITLLAAGTYDVTFTDNVTGCTSIVFLETLVNPGAPTIDPVADQVVCDTYTLLQITGTGLTGNETFWSGPGATGTQFSQGDVITTSMTIYMFDVNGVCAADESFVITVNYTPVLDPILDVSACDSYFLPAITGTNISGSAAYYDDSQANAGSTITGPLTSTQTVWMYDANGTCQDEISFVVTVNPSPTVTDVTGEGTYCAGDVIADIMVDVTGTADWTIDYTLDGTPQTTTGTGSPVSLGNTAGVYVVTGISDANCSNTAVGTQTIVINLYPFAPFAGTDTEYCLSDDYADMTASGSGGTMTWYSDIALSDVLGTGGTLSPVSQVGVTTYYVTETLNDCEGPESMVTISMIECEIVIPTAFTPDGDLINDNWEVLLLDQLYPDNIVSVYNRWGNLIYQSDQGNYGGRPWEGMYNNELMPVGSYYYIIELNNSDNETETGTVSIILNK
ncbi:MAG: gliding motility-associated C-terminal domain-containing protein [Crocinitomicaceae bacterium]|nr:gliding motility-associated C-terminal domain-containing protein [Crocinitomicaceae bacterium]